MKSKSEKSKRARNGNGRSRCLKRVVMPLELHDALSAITMSIHAIHQTMCQTPLYPQNHLRYDGVKLCEAIEKVGKLKRPNESSSATPN
jgi:hypothetical protein